LRYGDFFTQELSAQTMTPSDKSEFFYYE
jgi:hypothetical protein